MLSNGITNNAFNIQAHSKIPRKQNDMRTLSLVEVIINTGSQAHSISTLTSYIYVVNARIYFTVGKRGHPNIFD